MCWWWHSRRTKRRSRKPIFRRRVHRKPTTSASSYASIAFAGESDPPQTCATSTWPVQELADCEQQPFLAPEHHQTTVAMHEDLPENNLGNGEENLYSDNEEEAHFIPVRGFSSSSSEEEEENDSKTFTAANMSRSSTGTSGYFTPENTL